MPAVVSRRRRSVLAPRRDEPFSRGAASSEASRSRSPGCEGNPFAVILHPGAAKTPSRSSARTGCGMMCNWRDDAATQTVCRTAIARSSFFIFSEFDEDFLFVQPPADSPVDQDERQGEAQRAAVVAQPRLECMGVDLAVNRNIKKNCFVKHYRHQRRRGVDEERVAAEHFEEAAESAPEFLFLVREPD